MSEVVNSATVVHLVDDDDEVQSAVSHVPSIGSISQIPESGDTLLLDWVEEQQIHSVDTNKNAAASSSVEDIDAKRGRKRVRETTTCRGAVNQRNKKSTDPSAEAYRQSQRMMRKEGKQVCMKDVLLKTVMSPISFSESNKEDSVISLMSPTTSSVWSPQVANDITSQFLSSVEAKKKRRFEKFVARDSGNSQTSSPLLITPMSSGADTFSVHRMNGELVICDEDANMSPPSDELFLYHEKGDNEEWSTEKEAVGDIATVRLDAGQDEKTNRGRNALESLISSNRSPPPSKLSEEQEETLEKERAAAIARKHRIWELQQQSRKIEKEFGHDTTNIVSSMVSSPSFTSSLSPLNGPSFQPPISGSSYDLPENFSPVPSLHRARHAHDVSISESNLSHDDISMIQRINSFEKTSAQRVVVFSSAKPT